MNKHGAQNTGKTIKRILSYMKKYKFRFIFVLICILLSAVANVAGSMFIGTLIDDYITPLLGSTNPVFTGLLKAICVMGIVYLVGILATLFYNRTMVSIAQGVLKKIRDEMFEHMQTLPIKFFDTHTHGDIMSYYTNDTDTLRQMMAQSIPQMFSSAVTIISVVVAMFISNVYLAIFVLVFATCMMFVIKKIAGASGRFFVKQQQSIGKVNGYIEETMTGQKVVKVFCHENVAEEEFEYLNDDLRGKQIFAQFFGGIMGPVMGNLSQVSYSLTAMIGGILCVLQGFDIGGLTVFVNYSRQFSRPINELSMQMNTIFSALAGAERVFQVMDEAPETADAADAVVLNPCKGHVELKDVTFGYVPGHTILKHISLYAKPGQKIAFVGSTGAGKTTITNLINRFYEIDSGEILMDGVDIRKVGRENLRSNIAMVLQDTHLFTGTIRENIRYGRLDATDAEVEQAAKMASAHSFIMRLENGYDTMIEGDGANLSQGQRQLLNIARAAISKAPVLILDEATSSVDTRTERHIEHGMDRLMAERTTLVIAHRLSTVRNANAIMVLENGEIIERGDHDQLLEQKGRYYELYTGKKQLA